MWEYPRQKENHGAVPTEMRTGAAMIMVAVFSVAGAADMVMFQQVGMGLAIAIFLDATIIRSILVPATMKLLGKWNWWFPIKTV